MIRPARGVAERSPDRDTDRLRREAIIETDSSSAVEMACANCSASESAGIPRNAALMSSSALSGSRKKSPETATSDSRPSATSTSTATSFPPGTLYSPRIRPAYPAGFSAVSAVEDHTARAVRICSEGKATKQPHL